MSLIFSLFYINAIRDVFAKTVTVYDLQYINVTEYINTTEYENITINYPFVDGWNIYFEISHITFFKSLGQYRYDYYDQIYLNEYVVGYEDYNLILEILDASLLYGWISQQQYDCGYLQLIILVNAT